ncbi:ABC transporter ATP-binding protein [Streptococcus pneumoniae]|nr:ABC transporter ATP-binding protein [Streptococcus pneumoniae]
MSEIEIINAKKIYHDVPVIENLNITIPKGSLFTLLGASGCGKTTLLRMIAGFNSIEGGEFYFDDTKINNMEPSKRNIGMVFQNYAIFPHLTVRDNVAFGLMQKKVPKEGSKRRIDSTDQQVS